VKEIDWIEATADYVKLNVGKDSYLMREGVGSISNKLDPNRFVRIHRSLIVNVRKIKELQPCDSGEYIAVLKSGKELSCSRAYRAGLQRLIDINL
jgi:two-component system LytT family response regulator